MEIEIEKVVGSDFNQSDCDEIVQVSADKLTYNQFFNEYMVKNIPILIKDVKIKTQTSNRWIDGNGQININAMEEILKDEEAPVYNCSINYYNSHEQTTMKFSEYADYWRSERENLNYLKDFHLKQQRKDLDFYTVPQYFASDWLNEYLIDTNKDDYRFVYLGTKGTWTPVHADVFGSYSWSVNLSGRKRWIFMPPGEENKLAAHNQFPLSIHEEMLRERGVKYFILMQEANDAIFVPSQWYHQVENLTDVLSINHNWFNSCNISTIMSNLFKNFEDVIREVAHCNDMENFEDHCQIMLKSLFGMNFEEFVDILSHIADKRLDQIKSEEKRTLFDIFLLGNNHARHDLEIITKVLEEVTNVKDIDVKLSERTDEIICKIKS